MEPALVLENISKQYKSVQAALGVSLELRPGEIFGLIGPDGAGKSTLIHIAAGLLDPDQGKARLFGVDVSKDPEGIKPLLGILPQGLGLSLAQELSIEENINYFAEINQVPQKERDEMKEKLLTVTQLAPFRDRAAKNLSGGMKQKLGLCCTLIHSPKMVFLDEPTTGVDPISRRDIWYLINKIIKERELTIFLTTSYMDEAERCHRMALMHQGQVLALGDLEQLIAQTEGKLLEIHAQDLQGTLKGLKDAPGVRVMYPMGDKLNALCTGNGTGASDLAAFAAGRNITVERIEEGRPTLEDVFLSKVLKESGGVNQKALEELFGGGEGARSSSEDKVIVVQNLYKYFGKFAAVHDVTFHVKRGEIFGFLGPNGAGKTTTIKMLCGLFPPSSGSGTIVGLDLMREQMKIKKSIGYMSQKFSLYRDLTVGENIELYGGIYGVSPVELKRRKSLILQIADLEGKDRAITDSLPMGIKQRLALGCAIIHKPEVIFLDEPTSGVDPIARRLFWDIIFFLSRQLQVTILVTTHYMDEAEQCDRLSLMHLGKLIALGSPQGLKSEIHKEIGAMLEILVDAPFEALEVVSRAYPFCNIFGRTLHLYTPDVKRTQDTIGSLLGEKGIQVKEVRTRLMPFEDVFVYFCEKAEKEGKKE
ncbi:MAG: ABC transporter ATP-binding protein [Armatimonadetes bacterium]|nr:ABC transporter ATP-binding protein [Armatimonadota bacterium]